MIIGLTGSIACGKSVILNYLKEKGIDVLSLDELSHELFNEKEINAKIKEALNITSETFVTRKEVSNVVFQDKEKLVLLNKIMHPAIILKMNDIIALSRKNNQTIVIETPLLYELDLRTYFDQVWFVYVSKENQIKRLMSRNNYSIEEAKKRIESQIDVDQKRDIALKYQDTIIDNNQKIEYTYKVIDELLENINL